MDNAIEVVSLNIGRLHALKDVSFSVSVGGIHGILSAQSAQTTMLLDVLSGYCAADSGVVRVLGEEMSPKRKTLKKRIGYVSAKPSFYPDMTVLEVLDFVGCARGALADKRYRQIEEAMELFGLLEVANCLTRNLSDEQKKRLSFAASLLGGTELLLLDEPLLGISEDVHREILSLIGMIGKHKTVLLATQDASLIKELCQDVLVLCDGMVLAHDTPSALEKIACEEGYASFEVLFSSVSEQTPDESNQANGVDGEEEK